MRKYHRNQQQRKKKDLKKIKNKNKNKNEKPQKTALVLRLNNLGLQTLERSARNVLNKSVDMRLFVLSTLSGKTHTDAVRGILHTTAPEELVHRGVDANILGAHSLLGKLLKRADSLRSTLLELNAKNVFVDMHGALTSKRFRGLHHF